MRTHVSAVLEFHQVPSAKEPGSKVEESNLLLLTDFMLA